MPTYQLVCDDCGKDYEFFLTRVLRDSDKKCPSCGGTNVRQVYREFLGFRLGGSRGSSGSSCGESGSGKLGGFR